MKTEHSPTPWVAYATRIRGQNDLLIADAWVHHADAFRIVACVNACEGLSNEQLIKNPVLELLKKTCESHNQDRLDKKVHEGIAYRLKMERDELLEALREMVAIAELTVGWMPQQPNADGPLIKARAAIAKAEGVKS